MPVAAAVAHGEVVALVDDGVLRAAVLLGHAAARGQRRAASVAPPARKAELPRRALRQHRLAAPARGQQGAVVAEQVLAVQGWQE